MPELDGVALVTGAGSGIGRALSLAYARAGCRGIALADVNMATVEETIDLIQKEGIETKFLALKTDITDLTSVKEMVSKTVGEFGSLDYAANVAGVAVKARASTAEVPHDDYDRVMDINVRGQMLCMQEEIKVMRHQEPTTTPGVTSSERAQRGSIVNIASMSGFLHMQNIMPYTVSKHAVLGLTRAAAVDHGHQKIRINSVCPATVDTPFITPGRALNPGSTYAEDMNVFSRLALPEEIADVCVFLSSSRSSYMSGASVAVDAAISVTARYQREWAKD